MIASQFSFDLFPASGLDNSLFTAVLLGLLCVFLLTESLGWIFTGLVVPGYLASVFIIQPLSGSVIVFEAALTYLLARAISDWMAPFMPWNRFFGRERFFLILLCSVGVRLVCEMWLLPGFGTALSSRGWAPADLSSNLFSIGLIVVPLTANMMWKTGIVRGLPQVIVPTVLVFVLLRFLLIPFTNLSISDFELSYENVALGFLVSPKTYIILLTGAYLAARNNIAWGWDSNGIVVLALVALAWLSPLKVLTTVIEVMLLVVVVRAVLTLPWLTTANLEGSRRIVLVFGIGFTLKFLGCHLLAAGYPGLKATDYFGFGYLLPSLLALKILQKGNAAVILFPTLQTSALSLALGSIIGFSMAMARPDGVEAWLEEPPEANIREVVAGLTGTAHLSSGRLLAGRPPGERGRISRDALGAYRQLVHEVISARGESWDERQQLAHVQGMNLRPLLDPRSRRSYWILDEPSGDLHRLQGWGLVAVREDTDSPLVVEVPHPVSEPGALVCGAILFEKLGARALIVSGMEPTHDTATPSLVGRGDLPLAAARNALAGHPVLEVRTRERAGQNLLWIPRQLPHDVDMLVVREQMGPVDLAFANPPGADAYGDPPSGDRVRLDLSSEGLRTGRRNAYPGDGSRELERELTVGLAAMEEQPWFQDRCFSDSYQPLKETDLTYLQREVLTPLIADGPEAFTDPDQLLYLDGAAAQLGYGVESLQFPGEEAALLLSELPPARRGWGSIIVRPTAETARFLAVPSPQEEKNSLTLALHLAQELDAYAVIIGGARGGAAHDGSADVLREGHLNTLFTAAHRVMYREAHRDLVPFGMQVRGYSAGRPLMSQALLTAGVVSPDVLSQSPDLVQAARRMQNIGIDVQLQDGSRELADLRGYGVPQLHLARNLDGLPYAILWASPGLRRRVSLQAGERMNRVAHTTGLRPVVVVLEEELEQRQSEGAQATARGLDSIPAELPPRWHEPLSLGAALIRTGDYRYLADLVRSARASGISVRWTTDSNSGLPLLWLEGGRWTAVINPLAPDPSWDGEVLDAIAALRTGTPPLVLLEGE